MGKAIRIGVLDDDPLYSLGVDSVLNKASGFEFTTCGASAEEISSLPSDRVPDVILVDSQIADAVQAVRGIYFCCPSVKVIMLADPAAPVSEVDVALCGAIAWLRKDLTGAELARAVQAAYLGQTLMDAGLEERLIAVDGSIIERAMRVSPCAISSRGFEVMSLVCRGLTNKEVAGQMGLSEPTVKMHFSSIRSKLGARSRLEAAIAFKRTYDHSRRSTSVEPR